MAKQRGGRGASGSRSQSASRNGEVKRSRSSGPVDPAPGTRVLGESSATKPTTGRIVGRDLPSQTGVAVLGAGIAGMSAALHIKKDYEIFEQAERIGGLCCTENFGGYLFDRSIHILYTKQPYAKKFITGILGKNFDLRPKYSYIYSHGVYTAYPYQSNTYGLPKEVVVRNLMGLIEATYHTPKSKPKNFKEWAYATFGAGITEEFFLPFNYKVWAIPQDQMSYDWIADRVLTPPIQTAIEGAVAPSQGDYGPNARFWYPKRGGMETLPRSMGKHLNDHSVHTFTKVKRIHVKKHQLEFEDGSTCSYDHLISTAPISKLAMLADSIPQRVRKAVDKLKWNTVYTVNIGLEIPNLTPMHWAYYPDPDLIFHRLSWPKNFAPSMAPANCSSVAAEISASKWKDIGPTDSKTLIKKTIDGLIKIGLITREQARRIKPEHCGVIRLEPAYVLYTWDHRPATKVIHDWLESHDIYACGRFGDFEYLNMDHSILSGKRAAEKMMGRELSAFPLEGVDEEALERWIAADFNVGVAHTDQAIDDKLKAKGA
ncbi:MAG: protoporphyrinogen/coproporphyrinogen oxidase [Phycisphaerales bacterium]